MKPNVQIGDVSTSPFIPTYVCISASLINGDINSTKVGPINAVVGNQPI